LLKYLTLLFFVCIIYKFTKESIFKSAEQITNYEGSVGHFFRPIRWKFCAINLLVIGAPWHSCINVLARSNALAFKVILGCKKSTYLLLGARVVIDIKLYKVC
jgi:hypothetical protein